MHLKSLLELLENKNNRIPLSYKQAQTITHSYQHLVGRKINGQFHVTPILHVVTAPFHDAEKKVFIQCYNDSGKFQVLQNAPGRLYEVIVVANTFPGGNGCIYQDIRDYTFAHDIALNPDDYLSV